MLCLKSAPIPLGSLPVAFFVLLPSFHSSLCCVCVLFTSMASVLADQTIRVSTERHRHDVDGSTSAHDVLLLLPASRRSGRGADVAPPSQQFSFARALLLIVVGCLLLCTRVGVEAVVPPCPTSASSVQPGGSFSAAVAGAAAMSAAGDDVLFDVALSSSSFDSANTADCYVDFVLPTHCSDKRPSYVSRWSAVATGLVDAGDGGNGESKWAPLPHGVLVTVESNTVSVEAAWTNGVDAAIPSLRIAAAEITAFSNEPNLANPRPSNATFASPSALFSSQPSNVPRSAVFLLGQQNDHEAQEVAATWIAHDLVPTVPVSQEEDPEMDERNRTQAIRITFGFAGYRLQQQQAAASTTTTKDVAIRISIRCASLAPCNATATAMEIRPVAVAAAADATTTTTVANASSAAATAPPPVAPVLVLTTDTDGAGSRPYVAGTECRWRVYPAQPSRLTTTPPSGSDVFIAEDDTLHAVGNMVDVEQLGSLASTYTTTNAKNGQNQPITLYAYYFGLVRVEAADYSHVAPAHTASEYYASPRGVNLRRQLLAPESVDSLLRRQPDLRSAYRRRAAAVIAERDVRHGAVTFHTSASAATHAGGVTFIVATGVRLPLPAVPSCSTSALAPTETSSSSAASSSQTIVITPHAPIRNQMFTLIGRGSVATGASTSAGKSVAVATSVLDGTVGLAPCTACTIRIRAQCNQPDGETADAYDPGAVIRGRHAHPMGLSLLLRFGEEDSEQQQGLTAPSQSLVLRVPRSIDEASAPNTVLDPATGTAIRFPNGASPNAAREFSWFVNPDLFADRARDDFIFGDEPVSTGSYNVSIDATLLPGDVARFALTAECVALASQCLPKHQQRLRLPESSVTSVFTGKNRPQTDAQLLPAMILHSDLDGHGTMSGYAFVAGNHTCSYQLTCDSGFINITDVAYNLTMTFSQVHCCNNQFGTKIYYRGYTADFVRLYHPALWNVKKVPTYLPTITGMPYPDWTVPADASKIYPWRAATLTLPRNASRRLTPLFPFEPQTDFYAPEDLPMVGVALSPVDVDTWKGNEFQGGYTIRARCIPSVCQSQACSPAVVPPRSRTWNVTANYRALLDVPENCTTVVEFEWTCAEHEVVTVNVSVDASVMLPNSVTIGNLAFPNATHTRGYYLLPRGNIAVSARAPPGGMLRYRVQLACASTSVVCDDVEAQRIGGPGATVGVIKTNPAGFASTKAIGGCQWAIQCDEEGGRPNRLRYASIRVSGALSMEPRYMYQGVGDGGVKVFAWRYFYDVVYFAGVPFSPASPGPSLPIFPNGIVNGETYQLRYVDGNFTVLTPVYVRSVTEAPTPGGADVEFGCLPAVPCNMSELVGDWTAALQPVVGMTTTTSTTMAAEAAPHNVSGSMPLPSLMGKSAAFTFNGSALSDVSCSWRLPLSQVATAAASPPSCPSGGFLVEVTMWQAPETAGSAKARLTVASMTDSGFSAFAGSAPSIPWAAPLSSRPLFGFVLPSPVPAVNDASSGVLGLQRISGYLVDAMPPEADTGTARASNSLVLGLDLLAGGAIQAHVFVACAQRYNTTEGSEHACRADEADAAANPLPLSSSVTTIPSALLASDADGAGSLFSHRVPVANSASGGGCVWAVQCPRPTEQRLHLRAIVSMTPSSTLTFRPQTTTTNGGGSPPTVVVLSSATAIDLSYFRGEDGVPDDATGMIFISAPVAGAPGFQVSVKCCDPTRFSSDCLRCAVGFHSYPLCVAEYCTVELHCGGTTKATSASLQSAADVGGDFPLCECRCRSPFTGRFCERCENARYDPSTSCLSCAPGYNHTVGGFPEQCDTLLESMRRRAEARVDKLMTARGPACVEGRGWIAGPRTPTRDVSSSASHSVSSTWTRPLPTTVTAPLQTTASDGGTRSGGTINNEVPVTTSAVVGVGSVNVTSHRPRRTRSVWFFSQSLPVAVDGRLQRRYAPRDATRIAPLVVDIARGGDAVTALISPSLALQGSRASMITDAVQCVYNSEELDEPLTVFPLQPAVPLTAVSVVNHLLGGILVSSCLMSFPLVILLLCHLHHLRRSGANEDGNHGQRSGAAQLAAVGILSSIWCAAAAFFASNVLRVATMLTLNAAEGCGATCWLLLATMGVVMPVVAALVLPTIALTGARFKARLVWERRSRCTSQAAEETIPDPVDVANRPSEIDYKPVYEDAQLPNALAYVKSFGPFFDGSRDAVQSMGNRLSYVVETTASLVAGLLTGLRPSTQDRCKYVASGVFCCVLVVAVYSLVWRPYISRTEAAFVYANCLLQLVAAGVAVFATVLSDGNDDRFLMPLAWLSLIQSVVSLAALMALAGQRVVLWIVRRRHFDTSHGSGRTGETAASLSIEATAALPGSTTSVSGGGSPECPLLMLSPERTAPATTDSVGDVARPVGVAGGREKRPSRSGAMAKAPFSRNPLEAL